MNADLLQSIAAWAWRTSLEALPLALVVVLLSRWRGLPLTWRWWLPALFFVRLAMPQVPEAAWHWWNLAPSATVEVATEITSSAATASTPVPWLPVLWALGCFVVTGWVIVSHWRLARWIQRSGKPAGPDLEAHCDWAAARLGLSRRVPIRVLPGWPTMAVCGWLRPVLLLPADLEERFSGAQMRGMFLHEMTHVQRRDVLWTWLALGLCALHWFNPLAWLALRRFHADRELACDAAALQALEPAARHDYGEALLLCLQSPALHAAPALAPFFRRFPELKQRLQNIMKPSSPTLRNQLLTALLIPTFAAVTFTTARAQREGEAPKPAPEGAPAEKPVRDGEMPKAEKRDGEAAQEKAREGDGEKPRRGPRDGEGERKAGPRDGDEAKKVARDGDQPKAGPRDGEVKKAGARDGDQPRKGPRDGEGARKAGARDGEVKKQGARDGDAPKAGAREGDAAKPAREGDRPKADGEKPEAR